MQYRKEIDGLRALAVLPVLLFHAGFQFTSGGYIGVDIFFVISGYLITSIILDELENNCFSVVTFYERRARRILPALSFVLVATTIASYLLMPADLLIEYSESLISVSVFASNIFYYLSSGYFSTASDEKPLLHTWSLAVEEQYYVFIPIFMLFAWRFGRKFLFMSIIVFLILSLAYAERLALKSFVNANFYLIFSRAWELLFGSAMAFAVINKQTVNNKMVEFASITGLAMILMSITFYDSETPFPSLYTLLPVVGTCLIIAFATAHTFVGRVLSSNIFVFTGLISYSLYLWHQPLFAFFRLKSISEPQPYVFILLIGVTYLLAFISWKYVEAPFRNKTLFNRTAIFKFSLISIISFSLIGAVGIYYNGFEKRFQNIASIVPDTHSPKRGECHTQGKRFLKPKDACKYFGEKIKWAVFGDSHTVEIAYALAEKLKHENIGLVHLSFSSCPPALLYPVKQPGCNSWLEQSLIYLEKNADIKNVVVGFRHSAYLFGDQLDSYPVIPSEKIDRIIESSFLQTYSDDTNQLYWDSFSKILNRLLTSGKRVHVLYPIPELPADVSKIITPITIFNNNLLLKPAEVAPASYYYTRNKFILEKLNHMNENSALKFIKPSKILCGTEYCRASENNHAIYFDDDHLGIYGAKLLVETIELF